MTLKALEEQIKSGKPERVYLFYGPERYMLHFTEGRLIKSAIANGDPVWNVSRFSSDAKADSVYDACYQLPMGGPLRVVCVENCPAFDKAESGEDWANVIKNVPDTCILLFIHGEKIDGRLLAAKAVGADRQVHFEAMGEAALCELITKSVAARGFRYRPEALHQLVYQAGFDAGTLAQETRKLESYVYPRKEITVEDVKKAAITNETADAFEITDDLIEENYESAFARLSLYLRQGGIILMLRGAVAYKLRELMAARRMLDAKKPSSAILQSLKGPRIAREKTLQTARHVNLPWLERALCALAEGDYMNKSGQIGDERQAFELSLIRAFIENRKGRVAL